MREDRYRFTELETFVSVVEAISERGIREMMAVRSQQFNAGREMLSQEFCHTGAMLKVAVMALWHSVPMLRFGVSRVKCIKLR